MSGLIDLMEVGGQFSTIRQFIQYGARKCQRPFSSVWIVPPGATVLTCVEQIVSDRLEQADNASRVKIDVAQIESEPWGR
jgi:hypothetical protein